MSNKTVVLVGAGNIAHAHAAAIREIPGVSLLGVIDVNPAAARALASTYGASQVFATAEEAIASGADAFHILTPPDLHLRSALPYVQAGKTVLLEKPIGVSVAECDALRSAAQASGAVIGVNQNLIFNPAYVQLKQAVQSGRLGKPLYVDYVYEVPLRQLAARQFGHWMFREPVNILLEQAVHPLSQVVDLAGAVHRAQHPGPDTGGNLPRRRPAQRLPALPAVRAHAGPPALSCRRQFHGLPHDRGLRRRRGRGRHVCQPVPHPGTHRLHGAARRLALRPQDRQAGGRARLRRAARLRHGHGQAQAPLRRLLRRHEGQHPGLLRRSAAPRQTPHRSGIWRPSGRSLRAHRSRVQAAAGGGAGASRRSSASHSPAKPPRPAGGRARRHRLHRFLHRGRLARSGLPRARHGARRAQSAGRFSPPRR